VVGRLLVQLSLLGMYSLLYVESIDMHILVHAATTKLLHQRVWKFLLVGWGESKWW
jgi:hypothetical protein